MSLLGPPQVTWAEQPVLIARRQTRALLYRLATDLRPLPRTQLCYMFWPDVADATARRNLTGLLALLRAALPQPGVLLADDLLVTLDHEQVWSDTADFVRLMMTDDQPLQRRTLQEAVDLPRGSFLDGFTLPDCPEFEAWMDVERRAWERRTLDALAALIEIHTVARGYSAAIAAAERNLQADELAEEIHRRLIALYAAAADRTAALRQFERCVATLECELGVSPLSETRAMFEAVHNATATLSERTLDIAASILPPSPASAAGPRPVIDISAPTSSLIGRTSEVVEMTALLRRSDVRLLTLSGPGGAGKLGSPSRWRAWRAHTLPMVRSLCHWHRCATRGSSSLQSWWLSACLIKLSTLRSSGFRTRCAIATCC